MDKAKNKIAVINHIWLWLIVLAVLVGMAHGSLEDVTKSSFESAKAAVNLAIGLIGIMALWLGLMKIAEAGGLMRLIARAIRPLMVRLFPDVPAEHPAMAAIIMNMAANMLGLGNAATPLGIKAMIELNKLNRKLGKATDAMCLFLAINTSSVTILPLGVIGVRAAAKAQDPAAVMIPSMLATLCSTIVAVTAAKLLSKRAHRLEQQPTPSQVEVPVSDMQNVEEQVPAEESTELVPPGKAGKSAMWLLAATILLVFSYRFLNAENIGDFGNEVMRHWIVPALMLAIVVFGYLRGVKVYEVATEGAKEGFQVAVRIIPFLVMILVAIGMFKASGAFTLIADWISPVTSFLGIPPEVLPVALMRPLSGSGSFGAMSALTAQAPDSLGAFMAGVMQGSTETTFYVLAVYFGAVGITKPRYAIAAALLADLAGMSAAVVLARIFYPG